MTLENVTVKLLAYPAIVPTHALENITGVQLARPVSVAVNVTLENAVGVLTACPCPCGPLENVRGAAVRVTRENVSVTTSHEVASLPG